MVDEATYKELIIADTGLFTGGPEVALAPQAPDTVNPLTLFLL
jgi:hypothetical protein